jgi:hypothetical protein
MTPKNTVYLQVLAQTIKALATPFGTTTTTSNLKGVPTAHAPNADVLKMQQAVHDLMSKIISPANKLPGFSTDLISKLASLIMTTKDKPAPFKPDGSWGPITNNALQSLADVATILAGLPARFHLPNNVYSPADAKDLKQGVDSFQLEDNHITLTPEQQKDQSATIMDHVKHLSQLLDELVAKVPHISNDSILTPQQQALIKSHSVPLTVGNNQLSIPLSVLTNANQFDQFVSSLPNATPTLKNEILDALIDLPSQLPASRSM